MTETRTSYTVDEALAFIDEYDEHPAQVCPDYFYYSDPNNEVKIIAMYCKDFRNCAVCRLKRSKDLRSRILLGCARAEEAENPWPQWQTMPDAEASAFRQKLKRRDLSFLRIPVAGERVIFFYDYCPELGGRTVTYTDIAEEQGLDWERIATTPERKRTSGKLGMPIEEARAEDAILVELFIARQPPCLTKAQIEDCKARALAKTADLDPQGSDEAILACGQVTRALQVEFEAAAEEYYLSQGDDPATAQLNAFRDTPTSTIKRYWSPSSWRPWSDRLSSNINPSDDNRSRYSAAAVPGVDFIPAPVELMS